MDFEERVQKLESAVQYIEHEYGQLLTQIGTLNAQLMKNNAQTDEIFSVVKSIKGFVRVLGWAKSGLLLIGRWIVLPVVFLAALVYAITHHGELPPFWTNLVKALFLE